MMVIPATDDYGNFQLTAKANCYSLPPLMMDIPCHLWLRFFPSADDWVFLITHQDDGYSPQLMTAGFSRALPKMMVIPRCCW